ncbi:MAG: bifunctional glutamate N-acetyltransferase/amino-acid acetyltransferase ArgJ [Candidatus Omnitrophica bacterium]|nr:bifunctional glutamate N-acetyltransferase/amino-acid acetyltransferase ArgJ [Candidatus Omnitrophota bacterium]
MKLLKDANLPKGFIASGLHCGLKKSGKADLALFCSEVPARAACLFTVNKIQAAPISVSRKHLKASGYHQAIIVNSGNANCFTGPRGTSDALGVAKAVADVLGIKTKSVLVSSTGIIGRPLKVDKIKKAIPKLARSLSVKGIKQAKRAILTTDTFTKALSVKVKISGREVTICGVAKGSGMISPDMATMLGFIFTDADISKIILGKVLRAAVDESFNCITVDGCMSTNDTVTMLANGLAGNPLINSDKKAVLFKKALSLVCLELAKMIVKDGEGSSKFIQIKVAGAKTQGQAKRVGLTVANSNLVKTAIYAGNPNFGRIIAACGSSGAALNEKKLKVKVSPLKRKEVVIEINLNQGGGSSVIYTSDLTPKYIKINAEYN